MFVSSEIKEKIVNRHDDGYCWSRREERRAPRACAHKRKFSVVPAHRNNRQFVCGSSLSFRVEQVATRLVAPSSVGSSPFFTLFPFRRRRPLLSLSLVRSASARREPEPRRLVASSQTIRLESDGLNFVTYH